MNLKLLLIIIPILLSIDIDLVHCCSCLQYDPEYYYCKLDFVALIKTRSYYKLNRGGYDYYKYELLNIFRLNDQKKFIYDSLLKRKLWTRSHDSLCGVNLSLNKYYLITGHVNRGKARITLCDYFIPWSGLSIEERIGFRNDGYRYLEKICDNYDNEIDRDFY
jgi:hypothetical protein